MNSFFNPSKLRTIANPCLNFWQPKLVLCMTFFYVPYHNLQIPSYSFGVDWWWRRRFRNFYIHGILIFPYGWNRFVITYYRFNLFARLFVTTYRIIIGVYGIWFLTKIVFGDIFSKLQLLNIVGFRIMNCVFCMKFLKLRLEEE